MEMRSLGKREQRSLLPIGGMSPLSPSPEFRELIPGLPNELATEVFLHLPPESHHVAMKVNSLWRILLASRRFYVQRRLRFPYPSIILCRMLDRPPHQGSYSVCEFLDFDLSCPSLPARPIATQAFLRLYPPLPCSVSNITHRRISTSGLATSILLVNEGDLHRWMYFNVSSLKLGYFPCHGFMHGSDGLFTFMGCLGSQVFLFQKGFCWSYDCGTLEWRAHHGLAHGFAPDVKCRFGFGGHIYVRDVQNADVYAFDASTSEWNLHLQMTQRLASLSCFVPLEDVAALSAVVVATPGATLISAFENMFVRERVIIEYQPAGTTEWCHFSEIKRSKGTKFYLLNKEEQVFLIVTGGESFRHRVHRCEHFVLTCIFVPFQLFMNPFFCEG